MKNLSSKIASSNNKNGSTPNNADYCMAISVLKGNREYTNYGGSKYGASKERNPEGYLNAWGVDFQTGNDAPRGGKVGNYIELSPKGKIQTRVYRAEVAVQLAKEKAERLEQLEIQEQKNRISENEIIENIKENLQYFQDAKSKLAELKAKGNKDAWHVLANQLVQKASKNDASIGWSNIYKLIQKTN
jgi:hypothetical protein